MLKKIVFIGILIAITLPAAYLLSLPDTRALKTTNPTTSAIRRYREDQLRKKGKKSSSAMEWRRLDQISPHLAHAVVLAEDDTFFQHNGFDVEQLKRAARINWERKSFAFGASTLTQQLARTLYLTPRKNVLRKVKEALITCRLEKTLTKNRILELYLNVVEWGPQIYGAEAAAQHFFGVPAADLSPEQAIALAVILPSPRRYNPLNAHGFIARQKNILYHRLVRARYIPPAVAPETIETPPNGEEPPVWEDGENGLESERGLEEPLPVPGQPI